MAHNSICTYIIEDRIDWTFSYSKTFRVTKKLIQEINDIIVFENLIIKKII